MSLPSKFPDHECKKCGVTIKKGDAVNKVPAGNWCSNPQCPEPSLSVENVPTVTVPGPTATPPTAFELQGFARGEIAKLLTIEAEVLAHIKGAPDAKVGMFVKEIYRTYKNQEASS